MVLFALLLIAADLDVMPLPARSQSGDGRLTIDGSFSVALTGYKEPRLEAMARRVSQRLSKRTGIPLRGGSTPTLTIQCDRASKPVQAVGEDESYRLEVDAKQARLKAANPLGALRGVETFLQLVQHDEQGFGVKAITIDDKPRFPWRGLLIDSSRHFLPLEVLKRNLDGMAAVKMNVLHWHLSDDQGFRVESKRYTKLHQLGSDGHYYTQDQVRELIAYARDRGIRVVPEFDMPGHFTSWLVGYPELAAKPGPYTIERKWGVMDPVLDPTKDEVYRFLDGFIGEMAALFPDEFFHIGGDEVEGKHWKESATVQAFLKKEGLKDGHALQRYFNRRLQPIVQKHGKRMEGWDEILEPDLPKSIVIQSWRGAESLTKAVEQGYSGLLSSGYYLDLIQSTESHYKVHPPDRPGVLGGEACMWSEYVTPENIDSRIWPRNAAIAERFWSPAEVTDVDSMHRRMETVSRQLEWLGLTHRSSYRPMLERLAGSDPVEPLQTLADVVEPVKGYSREEARAYTSFTALTRLVDAARPESKLAIDFRGWVRRGDWKAVRRMLVQWEANEALLKPTLESHGLLREVVPVSEQLTIAARIGLEALGRIERSERGDSAWVSRQTAALKEAAKPRVELLLMIVPAVQELVDRAAR